MLNNILTLGLYDYIGIMKIIFFHGKSVTEIIEGMLFLKLIVTLFTRFE